MWICQKCNTQNTENFCMNCGAEFPQISADDLPPTVLGGDFGAFPLGGQNYQQPNYQQPNYQQPNYQPPQQPQFSPQGSLRIDFAGVWLLVDLKVEVYFDNQFVGTGSIKNGFSFTFAVGSGGGAHVLELKTALMSKCYDFMIPAGGNFQAQINYSRATGRFGSELSFNRF